MLRYLLFKTLEELLSNIFFVSLKKGYNSKLAFFWFGKKIDLFIDYLIFMENEIQFHSAAGECLKATENAAVERIVTSDKTK